MADYLTLNYAIIKACPNTEKHEYLNVGILVFHKDMVNIYLTQRPERLFYAFNNDINEHSLKTLQGAIAKHMDKYGDPEGCIQMLKDRKIRGFTVSDISEETIVKSAAAFQEMISDLMHRFIDTSYIHNDSDTGDGHLNVYSPFAVNMEGFIIGTREGLVQLREALDKALISNHGLASTSLVASEGEHYQMYVMRTDTPRIRTLQEMYTNDLVLQDDDKVTPEQFFDRHIKAIKEEASEKNKKIAGHKAKPKV